MNISDLRKLCRLALALLPQRAKPSNQPGRMASLAVLVVMTGLLGLSLTGCEPTKPTVSAKPDNSVAAKSDTTPDAPPARSNTKATDRGPDVGDIPLPATGKLRVGAWNIEWLGRPDRRGGRRAQAPVDLADYIMASGVDVLGLEEISDTTPPRAGMSPANHLIDKAMDIIAEKTGDPWKCVLFPKPDEADRDQLCGVMWNTNRAKMVGLPMAIPVERSPGPTGIGEGEILWRRAPYAVKFTAKEAGKSDFVLIVVHMKSNRAPQGAPENITAIHRKMEAEALVRALPVVTEKFANERDIIILGDTNVKTADEPCLKVFREAGLRDLNERDATTWHNPFQQRFPPAPFDRILVPADQPEFADAVQTVYYQDYMTKRGLSDREFKDRLSDHAMVFLDMTILNDDD